MPTTCKRLMVRKEIVRKNQYGSYTSMVSRPAKAGDIERYSVGIETTSAMFVMVGPGEEGLHMCEGQIIATVELYLDYGDRPGFEISYRCDRCKLEADKDAYSMGHWPNNQDELEAWLNQLLRDR